jgi:S-DNA-T family DNA segregation ATPase FtsK/SpoIIIE
MDPKLRRDVLGVLLLSLGGVTILALLSITRGTITAAWARYLRRLFGWGAFPLSALLLVAGLGLLWNDLRRRVTLTVRSLAGLEILAFAMLGLSHWFYPTEASLSAAQSGRGGGLAGWGLSYLLSVASGRFIGLLLLVGAAAVGLALLLRVDRADVLAARDYLRVVLATKPLAPPPADLARPTGEAATLLVKQRKRTARTVAAKAPEPPAAKSSPAPGPRRLRRDRSLPTLDLLDGGDQESYGEADLRYRQQLIEETLANFGVPAKVVETRQGPTVTQFGVEPGFLPLAGPDGQAKPRKVRVGQILALQDDLALALAASPIRIEAPVPGRSVVGIEVPNEKPSMVGLRGVVESKPYRNIDSHLRVALGKDVSGQPVAADLGQMPHLLIAGATGSGKSVCINTIAACLLLDNTPEDLSLIMVDPKMVELTNYNGVPHILGQVITNVEEVVRALRWLTAEMDRRYKLFVEASTRNIDSYNQKASASGHDKLPYVVMLIDELADLMMTAPDEIERLICRIAQMARATGIHLVIATQRPSVDVITGLIKANFPARISFAVTTQVDSRVVLDTTGAERLLGRGDMLYMASDSSKLMRLQGCFVSDDELGRLVNFWREKPDWTAGQSGQETPWANVTAAAGEQEDDLLEQAIDLARGRTSISTSFIQRHLRIGFPRAAHLIDLMEEQGVVGPAEDGGRSREVLVDEDSSDDLGEEDSSD